LQREKKGENFGKGVYLWQNGTVNFFSLVTNERSPPDEFHHSYKREREGLKTKQNPLYKSTKEAVFPGGEMTSQKRED